MCPTEFRDVRRFDTLPSTNTYLLDQARDGAPAGIVAVADHQSAGRGRLGRTWEAPPGTNLLVSLLIRPLLQPDHLPLVTLGVALAAADACTATGGVTPELKWPNDLVVGDAKLGGILAEVTATARGGPDGTAAVVVGLGLNVAWPGPPEVGGTCLFDLAGRSVDREDLLTSYLSHAAARFDALTMPAGRLELVEEARDRCSTLGRTVRVEVADKSITGTASAMTDEGRLLLVTDDGLVEIAAGDVIHLRATSRGTPSATDDPAPGGPL